MKRIGLFAGSFDPFTIGHADIVDRSCKLFDKVYVLVTTNTSKTRTFTHEEVGERIRNHYKNNDQVEVFVTTDRLTIDWTEGKNIGFLIRGIRDLIDFEYEKNLDVINKELTDIEIVFLMTSPQIQHISSSFVRELIKYNKPYEKYII